MSIYYRPPTNPNKSYAERRAERQQQDAEQRAAQKNEPIGRDPFYSLSADQRRAIRRSEEQGHREGEQRAAIETQATMQAAIENTPQHLRRPENVYEHLIAEHENQSYRPDVANRIKRFKRLAAERAREIDREMADKLRRYEVETNPETKPAREHWERASASAETDEERQQWARLRGLIDGGGAAAYWDQVSPIMQARLQKAKQNWDGQISEQAVTMAKSRAMSEQLAEIEELQVPSPVVTEQTETPQTGLST